MDFYESEIWFRRHVEKYFFTEISDIGQKFLSEISHHLKAKKKQILQFLTQNFWRCRNFWQKLFFIKRLIMHSYKPPYNGFIWYCILVNIREFWKKKFSKKKMFFSVVGKNSYIRAEISAHQKKIRKC
jgi:hypothetical protein